MNSAYHNLSEDFFVTGGTLLPDAPSYVERDADRDLYESLLQGKYCYILTARQMGKSSLMVRTAASLREAGVGLVVIADPTSVGQNATVDQWYVSMLSRIGKGLEQIDVEVEKFWQARALLSPVQRWTRALREIILPRVHGQLVIFVDEVDFVRSLPFRMDEFFAAIRECYNLRAEDAEMRRLTFCLVGVVAPSDLISDKRTTPFNIGHRIELHDFTATEAAPLARGLRRDEMLSTALLERVLYWTGGQPYLTQRLCQAVAEDSKVNDGGGVDRLCEGLFFTHGTRDQDTNLRFVRDRVLSDEKQRVGLLDLYAKTRKSKRVSDDGANPLVNTLRLSGIIRADGGQLRVRNRIYDRVFDAKWIEKNMPDAELRQRRAAYRRGLRRAAMGGGVILLLMGALAITAIIQSWRAEREAENSRRAAYYAQIRVAEQELRNANISRVEEILNLLKPEGRQEDLRGFEWDYLWQQCHRQIKALSLDHRVVAATFAPDGKQIAVAETIRTVSDGKPKYQLQLFDWAEGKELKSFETVANNLYNLVAFSPGFLRALVGGQNRTLQLLDLQTGDTLAILNGHESTLSALALSPDGQRAATADVDGNLQFWNMANKPFRVKQERQRQGIGWVSFSYDGEQAVIIVGSQEVKVLEVATGRELLSFNSSIGELSATVFSSDDRQLLLATRRGEVESFDLRTKFVAVLPITHEGRITRMVFSPNGKWLATASEDRTVKLWEVGTWRLLATIKGHGAAVYALAWSQDGKRIVTGGDDKQVKVWEVENVIQFDKGFEGTRVRSYLAAAFSQSGELLAFGLTHDGKQKILNAPAGRELLTLEGADGEPVFAVFSRYAELVAAGGKNNAITVWNVGTGKKVGTLFGREKSDFARAADFSPDGKKLVFRHDDRTLKVWETATGRDVATLESDITLPFRVTFSPDATYLAAARSDGSVAVWQLGFAQPLLFKGHTEQVRAIAFSWDGLSLATSGQDNVVKLWNARTGQELRTFGQADNVQRLTFSPDNKRLVTGGSDGAVKIWDVETGQQLLTLHRHNREVTSVAFTSDGKQLATSGADGVIRHWRIDDDHTKSKLR
jgi:WD40 repeat protein